MSCFKSLLWSAAVVSFANSAMAVTLINNVTRNGSFELVNGFPNTFKVKGWDAGSGTFVEGPNNGQPADIDNWTYWSGPQDDSGVQTASVGGAADGSMMSFLQGNDAVYNLTTYAAAVNDVFYFSWHNIKRGQRTHEVSLVYDNAGTITELTPSKKFSIAQGPNDDSNVDFFYENVYTIPAGSPAIGKAIGLGVHSTGAYPEIDNFTLKVNEVVEGDVNGDHDVNLLDFNIICDNFLLTPATPAQVDLTGTDVVDLDDFLVWRNKFHPGPASPTAAVAPEAAATLLSLAGLASAAALKTTLRLIVSS